MKSYDIIIFDLDGTITDSQEGIINSIHHSLARFHIEENDREKLKKFIGPPLRDSYKKHFGFDDVMADRAIGLYREYYGTKGIYENALYGNILDLIRDLHGRGKRLLMASTKASFYMEKILEHFSIAPYFEAAAGSNMDGTLTAKAELIQAALSRISYDLGAAIVMVGDRELDIAGAKKNGIDSIAVTYGYGTWEELEEANPDFIVASVEELRELLIR